MSSSYIEAPSESADDAGWALVERLDPNREGPIRGELLGLDRLEQRARGLARACATAGGRSAASPLLKRFADNARTLQRVHGLITAGGDHVRGIDVEWLLDNFHIVDDVLKEVRQDMPPGYDVVLPKLEGPPLKGYPRVYAISATLAAHADSEFDEERINRFVAAFQDEAALTIGELWALPTMLRLVLLENLRRLADQMVWSWEERKRADVWLAQAAPLDALEVDEGGTTPSFGTLSGPFVARLVQVLRDHGPASGRVMRKLKADVEAAGDDVDDLIDREHHRQAGNQVTVGNCVISLRLLSAVDWNAYFEAHSVVQAILRDDPSGVYPRQDFPTSDRCRKSVERLARGSRTGADELTVARAAVDLAAKAGPNDPRRGNVAYYLIDRGARELGAVFGYRPSLGERVMDRLRAHPRLVYFGSILVVMVVVANLVLAAAGAPLGLALVLAFLLAVSELAVGLINHFVTIFMPPRVLAKLEFKDGVPDEFRTIVVIPTMLVKPHHARALLERLEIHYLSNPDPNLRFALLTDFADALAEHMPDDQKLVDDALARVRALNARYTAAGEPDVFYLFHRRRLWNPSQGVWMGWERKRGKLAEFNTLLRGGARGSYNVFSVEPTALPWFRFVITLDSDTQMPRDTAGRLVGAIAHPLNQPRFDRAKGRVVEGYGVLQPRVSFHLTAATHSRFAALLASSGGIDPYSTAASDAYMDLFGVGSFTGKGVYDVDAFEEAAGDLFPENRILSHDLIEGNYVRCGLLSDTEVFDDFPARYHAYARREHRWVRGDWQLLPWLAPRVPTPEGSRPNPLPTLERWKLLDNLRRSLVPPAVVAMLALGWAVGPGSPWLWTAAALAVVGLPLLKWSTAVTVGVVRTGKLAPLKAWRDTLPALAGQAALSLALLPDQARLDVDAILRTLHRLFVSRRRLLEWETAASTEQRLGGGLRDFVATMWPSSAIAALVLLAVVARRPEALAAAGPILVAWIAAPVVAWWISRPLPTTRDVLTDADRRTLRRLARKTWGYFETFVGDDDHWLPPDNFQEYPDGRIAHRTSPTNMGLLLTATLSAHDLGYLGLGETTDRLERTFDALDRLETHWGHFYNWYDTRTLEPLPPAYISTVDSGNLLGCLVALRQGLIEKAAGPATVPSLAAGLGDALALAVEAGADGAALQAVLEEEADGRSEWLDRLEAEAARLVESTAAKPEPARAWARRLLERVRAHRADLGRVEGELAGRLLTLADRADAMGRRMEFGPLYKTERNLYAIGCNLAQGRLDGSCYDLLASESALTSYLTVARGDAPRKHWFQLGRPYIKAAGRIGLISWGGTAFEYLMPRLLLKSLPGTLLAEAARTAIARQIEYGRQLGLPWGISESAFAARHLEGDYRYQAFGAPGLGLKQGLDRDRVVAPYATAMATMVAPREAVANLHRLTVEGAEGEFGYYEAIDYTPDRLPAGKRSVVVKSYMSHHQGMSLTAVANVLLGDLMPRRFHAEPMVRAAELLLQERVPRDTPLIDVDAEAAAEAEGDGAAGPADRPVTASLLSRRLTTPATLAPRTHILSNARYHVMITNAGSGSSACLGVDVTRWREDPNNEAWGQFVYVRDVSTGSFWSAGFQPVRRPAADDEIVFAVDKATFRRRDGDVETRMEVAVSPEQLAEVRRVTLVNHGARPRVLEVTSYAEVALTPHAADLAHPAFHKLFLETEWLAESSALLARRRPRTPDEPALWALHVVATDDSASGGVVAAEVGYETDRARFLGRGRTPADPAALDSGGALSGATGAVLDPIFSLRRRLTLAPGGTAVLAFTTAVAETRAGALALADQYHGYSAAARAFELAWAHSQAEHGLSPWSPEEAHLFQRLGSRLLFAGPTLRGGPPLLESTEPPPEVLRRLGLAPARPIALARVGEASELTTVRQLIAAHDFLREKGLEFDLVLLDDGRGGLDEAMRGLVREAGAADRLDRAAGVFVVSASTLDDAARGLLRASARIVLDAARGPLAGQLDHVEWAPALPEPLTASPPDAPWRDAPIRLPDGLAFANGLGGFTADGREYVILIDAPSRSDADADLQPGRQPTSRPVLPPSPWINVVANPTFGFLATDAGSQTTWAGNSQTNRLTSWSNDPVSDPSAEVVYLRDEEVGQVWCPTPLPIPSPGAALVRHGQGYSTYTRNSHGIEHELSVFAAPDAAVKFFRLRVRNPSGRPRRLSATIYAEWVLGACRDHSAMHVVTELDPATGAILARNAFRDDFGGGVAFLDVDRRPRTITGDRGEFIGRHGSVAAPSALGQVELSGRVGSALDPCGAIMTKFDLAPGGDDEIVFLLGWAEGPAEVLDLIARCKSEGAATVLDRVKARWEAILGAVQVQTPDPALDVMLNRWLLYQTTSCRLWGRTAFHQSGGAFGFRDQLQDVLALCHAAPETARAHILLAASRQFVEGDAQHWWHPPAGQGVRTRCSDDYLWLPFAVAHYIETTGDRSILQAEASYLEAPALAEGQADDYRLPEASGRSAMLYDHCLRALDRSTGRGPRGLPLIGSGDWNDGLSRVGVEGRGESVWLAWFLSVVLRRFAAIAEAEGDAGRAEDCRRRAAELVEAAEREGWDGAWYRRAYFDDGTPLGSADQVECRIDSVAQSWAVIAGADAGRCETAMNAVLERLVRDADRLVLLLDPPFDRSTPNPGYIQGYVPGTRENGAQYSHAAAWVVEAAALLGNGDFAVKLFGYLNPINHALCEDDVGRYKAEPYALAGDVFSRPPHVGRGGWSWYTGSAGWMYRVGLETILGFRRRGDRLTIAPRVPSGWERFQITYRYGATTYEIEAVRCDARDPAASDEITLVDDGGTHQVRMGYTA